MRLNHPRRVSLSIVVLGAGLLSAGGCATNPQFVEKLPPPNFNGPSVAPQPSRPLPQLAQAPVKRPSPQASVSGVPREWIPPAGTARSWKWIVIHHSATPAGSARTFDRMHRDKGWDELGYHFVIGNGTGSGNGQVEVGSRWRAQKWGAHAKTADNRFNDYGIGICLVGNFDIDRPTAAQVASLSKLVAFLEKTYRITDTNIVGHGQTKATDCPGKFMNVAQIKSMARQALAEAGESTGPLAVTAGGDMLQDAHAGQ